MAFGDLRAQMFAFAFLITKVVHLSCAWNQTTELLFSGAWGLMSDRLGQEVRLLLLKI